MKMRMKTQGIAPLKENNVKITIYASGTERMTTSARQPVRMFAES